jgi:hypothetical protein
VDTLKTKSSANLHKSRPLRLVDILVLGLLTFHLISLLLKPHDLTVDAFDSLVLKPLVLSQENFTETGATTDMTEKVLIHILIRRGLTHLAFDLAPNTTNAGTTDNLAISIPLNSNLTVSILVSHGADDFLLHDMDLARHWPYVGPAILDYQGAISLFLGLVV